jgi:hypothetical protein
MFSIYQTTFLYCAFIVNKNLIVIENKLLINACLTSAVLLLVHCGCILQDALYDGVLIHGVASP